MPDAGETGGTGCTPSSSNMKTHGNCRKFRLNSPVYVLTGVPQVAALGSQFVDPVQARYLSTRWHLQGHPMFRIALQNRSLNPVDHGLSPEPSVVQPVVPAPNVEMVRFGETFAIPHDHYIAVKVPREENRRHAQLADLVGRITKLGNTSKVHMHRLAVAGLAAVLAKLEHEDGLSRTDAATCSTKTTGVLVREPASKRQRQDEKDEVGVAQQVQRPLAQAELTVVYLMFRLN